VLLFWEKDLEKHCKVFEKNSHVAHFIINDYEEEEHVKRRIT
jgi:hypothetical protein